MYQEPPDEEFKDQTYSRSAVVIALICNILAFFTLFVSFFSPFWMYQRIYVIDQGLLARCPQGRFACIWIGDDGFAWENSLPHWYKATQGLFGFGTLCVLTAFFLYCFHLCFGACKNKASTIAGSVSAVIFLGFVLVSIAVIIFGVRANAVYFAGGENGVNIFNWAFYIGVAGAAFSGVSSLFYLWGAYRIKKWERLHYERINAVKAEI